MKQINYLQLIVTIFVLTLTIAINKAYTQKRGYITSSPCPHSCKTMGIPKSKCRDWRQGNICYVEDLTKPPNRFSINQPNPPSPQANRPLSVIDICRSLDPYKIGSPKIRVTRIKKTGNFFKDKYKVYGSIEGACIQEAGYYENGSLVATINFPLSQYFRRAEFELTIRANRHPEIRAYNVFGRSDENKINIGDFDSDGYKQ